MGIIWSEKDMQWFKKKYPVAQTQTPPESEQAANQEPTQALKGSAAAIITEEWQKENDELFKNNPLRPVSMPIGCEMPPRTGYTSTQNREQSKSKYLPEDNDFCEEEPVLNNCKLEKIKTLKERWVVDVIRLDLTREEKLDLIGKLLDLGVA